MKNPVRIYGRLRQAYWNNEYRKYREKYDIHPTFSFRGSSEVRLAGKGIIHLGAHGYIGNFSSIMSEEDNAVWVGSGCAIAHQVSITTSQQIIDQEHYATDYHPLMQRGDVYIGNDCWICTGVFITPNVHIGNHVVVGANSVVTQSLPANTLCAGVPAKPIRPISQPAITPKYNA